MKARTFMQVSIGILALALAYHFGATSAGAQAGFNPIVAVEDGGTAYAANGDVYQRTSGGPPFVYTFMGNVFTGTPTPVQPTSFGALKVKYR
jgi:hypothetical protein